MGVAGVFARHIADRRSAASDRGELLLQLAQGELGEPGAHVPGVGEEVVLVVDGQQEGADGAGAAAFAGFPPDQDHFLRLDEWDSLSGAFRCRALSRSVPL